MAKNEVLIKDFSVTEIKDRFSSLISSFNSVDSDRSSIGTYNEKPLHKFLKLLFEPDENCHEVSVGKYVADIKNDFGITEIQTAKIASVSNRLRYFSSLGALTVVYPVAEVKYLSWIDPESGEVISRRKSNQKRIPLHILPELYTITDLVGMDNVTILCVSLGVCEYRLKDGWGRDGKRGSHRVAMYPESLLDLTVFRSKEDFLRILPFEFGDEFTSTEFRKACLFPPRGRHAVPLSLKVLCDLEIVERVGKRSNAYVYRVR